MPSKTWWANMWLFPELAPTCRRCRGILDRQGFFCSRCLKAGKDKRNARPAITGYIPQEKSSGPVS